MSTLRKTAEREQIEGAYNGATKDWAIVDVSPGTERVRMDGVSGVTEEITWQRYNGVRRGTFIPEGLWTEITKDLVVREAIEQCGYDFEETEDFYYILIYLRYVCISHPSETYNY